MDQGRWMESIKHDVAFAYHKEWIGVPNGLIHFPPRDGFAGTGKSHRDIDLR